MVLATADEHGVPSSRTVLCKGLDERGVVLYTNYTSHKSRDLNLTRVASVTFPWFAMQRQVQVVGRVERCSDAESDAYWAERPRGSQLGAWASAQSTVVARRTVLDDALSTVTQRFADVEEIPRPPHWGGWRIVPWQVEFWQGRHDRMHDRLRFELGRDDAWQVRRLAPEPPHPSRHVEVVGENSVGVPLGRVTVVGVSSSDPNGPTQPVPGGVTSRLTGAIRGAFADTTPLRTPAYRHLRDDRLVGLRRADRAVRPGPARGVRAVGRRDRGRGGPAGDAAVHRVAHRGHVAGAVGGLGVRGRQRVAGPGPVRVPDGDAGDEPADPQRGDPAAAPGRPAARRERAEHDGRAARRRDRPAAGRGRDPGRRAVDALPGRRRVPAGDAVGDVAAAADARDPRRVRARSTVGLRAVFDGFRYVGLHKILLVSFLIDVVAMGFGMPRVVFPEISQTVFGDPPGGGFALGLLFAAIPLGMVAGGVLSGWLQRVERQGVAVVAAVCVWGVGVAIFGLVGSLWLAVFALALAGAGDLVSSVYRSSMLQTVATDEMRGRMQGVFIVVVAGGPRLADLWHGPSAAAIGPA
ncbi:hypothetical protein L7F22_056626 [Adiantum nelumboides]|nr:hypothetical protein [Adiantum nelumboides]